MENISYIYGLFDPAEQVIRYVGQSTRPVARLGGHQSMHSSTDGATARAWIAEMLQCDRRPHMIILEICDFSVAHEMEAKWYQQIKGAGVNLLNEPTAIRRTKVHEKSKPYKHRLDPQQFCIIEPENFYISHEPECVDTKQKFGTVLEFVSAWQEPTVKVAITLLASQVEAMKQLGDGNLSLGIRKAIEMTTQTDTITIESISTKPEHDPYTNIEGIVSKTTLKLDPRDRTIWVTQEYNDNSTLMDEWNGLVLTWGIPGHPSDADTREWINENMSDFNTICNGYEVHWNGSNQVGRLTDEARAAKEGIEFLLDQDAGPANYYEVWTVDSWLEMSLSEITADMTDEQLKEWADGAEPDSSTIVEGDILTYITDRRDTLRWEQEQDSDE